MRVCFIRKLTNSFLQIDQQISTEKWFSFGFSHEIIENSFLSFSITLGFQCLFGVAKLFNTFPVNYYKYMSILYINVGKLWF